jgi:hypothetical protein
MGSMRHTAVILAAALMFALVAPALTIVTPANAQPFADVPTNHWAYDAIAELAAKGLVEGYPDGTFKGDRAMTRYEMAMVVARLLARIESIQIPAPQGPQVTAEDLAAIQRLINEFRAELAALGVRVTAIEEELNAIKARLDNVRITGRFRFRYDGGPTVCGASVNGNGNTCAIDSGTSPYVFRARWGAKLVFDGSVAPDVHAILGISNETGITSTEGTFNSSNIGTCTGAAGGAGGNCTPNYNIGNISEAYFDWNHAWGLPLRIQLGRMGYAVMPVGGLPIQFGPYGLLVNTNSDTYGASAGDTGLHTVDGLRLSGNIPDWADFTWQAAVWRVDGPNGGGTYFLGEDAYGIDANIKIIPGLRLGGYWVANNINSADPQFPSNATSALWHVYGNPSTPMSNPPTAHCPAVGAGVLPASSGGGGAQGGIQCPALGSGGGGYVDWDIVPGVHFDVEAAQWNDGVLGGSDSAYWGGVTFDLGALTGWGHHLSFTLSYEDAGMNFYAPYQADVDSNIIGSVGPGNAQLLYAALSLDITDAWSVYGGLYTGSQVSNGQGIQEYTLGVIYHFAPNATLNTFVDVQKINGITQSPETFYRSQLDYSF